MARRKKHPTVRDIADMAIELHFALCDKVERSKPINNQVDPFAARIEMLQNTASSLMCNAMKLADEIDLWREQRMGKVA